MTNACRAHSNEAHFYQPQSIYSNCDHNIVSEIISSGRRLNKFVELNYCGEAAFVVLNVYMPHDAAR